METLPQSPANTHRAEGPIVASVIITAHDRKQYLRSAIESVVSQDFDSASFEIIVVKNFLDEGIDSELDQIHAKRIICREKPINSKAAAGLDASVGEVIFFLDDDDLFESNKLRIVLEEFKSDPELGFYQNQVTYIGPDGLPLDRSTVHPLGGHGFGRARRARLYAGSKLSGLAQLVRSRAGFNTSSMAIRRDVAIRSRPYLGQLNGAVDTFFFFAALVSPYSLLFDNRVLTRYRAHDQNVSLVGGSNIEERRSRFLESARDQNHVNLVIRQMILDAKMDSLLKEIDGQALIGRLSLIFRGGKSNRLDDIRELINVIRLRATLALRENRPMVAGAVLYAFFPTTAKRAYEHLVGIR